MILPRSLQQARTWLIASPVAAALLPLAAWQIGTMQGWVFCLGLLCIISTLAWWTNERYRRAIANTPTAKIGSAPQGYVELIGQARFAGDPVFSPVTGLPCIWYRCLTERADSDNHSNYQYVSTDESTASILIADTSGEALIDPDGAQIEVTEKSVHINGEYRHTVWLILPGQRIFALGEFASVRGDEHLNLRQDISLRLADIKKDKQELLRRFDKNRDGEIDLMEWEAVRTATELEILAEHRAERAQPATHILRRPSNNQLFLITTRDPERQLLRYRLWRWFHLIVLVCALQTLWFLQHTPRWLNN